MKNNSIWEVIVIKPGYFKNIHLETIKKIFNYYKKNFIYIKYNKIPLKINHDLYVKYKDCILIFEFKLNYNTYLYSIFKIIYSKLPFKIKLYNKIN